MAARVEVNISLAFLHWVRITLHPWPVVCDKAIFVQSSIGIESENGVTNVSRWVAMSHNVILLASGDTERRTSPLNIYHRVPGYQTNCPIWYTGNKLPGYGSPAYWLRARKGIRPVKTDWWGTVLVMCLEPGACKWFAYGPSDATAPIISCSSKIQNSLPFWCWLTQIVL